MIDVSKKSWHKYFLFGSLYFSEGLQWTLATVIIPIYLVDKGYSLSVATLVAGVGIAPWWLKFVFGPTIDYFYKYGKKPFIIIGGLLGAICLFILVYIDPSTSLILFAFFLFLSHLGTIYLDISCDGWAIQISTEKERGKINGAMFAGLFTGMTVTTPLLALLAQDYGYGMSFLASGGIILALLIYPFFVKNSKILEKRSSIASLLKQEFKKKTTQLITLFGLVIGIGSGLLMYVVPLYMKTILNMTIGQIGLVSTIYPFTLVMGSLAGGALADRWGRKIVLYIVLGASIISAAFIYADTWQILAVIYGVVGFLGGGILAASSALQMDICNPKIGTTQYSILISITNFGEEGTGTISGFLVTLLGFGRVFLYSAWILGPALLLLYFIRPKKNELFGRENG